MELKNKMKCTKPTTIGRAQAQSGMSIIEVLIAMGLLAIITVGILPLFVQSVNNNLGGRRASTLSALATSELEVMLALPYNDPQLNIPGGSTEVRTLTYWNKTSQQYVIVANEAALEAAIKNPAIPVGWSRRLTIRQHTYLPNGNGLIWSAPLDGAAIPQFKDVHMRYQWVGVGGVEGRAITVHAIRAF